MSEEIILKVGDVVNYYTSALAGVVVFINYETGSILYDRGGSDCFNTESLIANYGCGEGVTTNGVYIKDKIVKVAPPCETQPPSDVVNNPPHYTAGEVECIDAIKAALGRDGFIAFLRGQVIKYNWRMLLKDNALQDAKKAQYYQNKLVEELGNVK